MSELSKTIHEWHLGNRRILAYVRACDEMDLDEQYEEIERYAKVHGFKVTETYCDIGMPEVGLRHAMAALQLADALVVCNLNRLVKNKEDRMHELRPILHHFCSTESDGKHLISIEEGINTSTAAGQMNALQLVNGLKDSA